ncbi:MAG: FAD-linked oxidase, partial [Deltaproteobacteria bacterium]|nr:FAD-linked oxidase [Deltaproteobacteria bacterium]
RLRLPIRAIELLDEAAIEALRKEGRKLDGASDGARAVLLVELEGEEMELDHAIERLAASVEALAHEVIVARNERLRLRLWQVRSEASRALRRSARFKLSEDVVVPRPQLGALLEVCQRIKESHKVRIAAYGHAGDANLHVNFLWDEPSDRARVEMAIAELMAQVIWLGGGLSGEHGIGRAKVGFVGKGGDAQRLRWLREFKRLFDPAWIMNPGKVIPRSD